MAGGRIRRLVERDFLTKRWLYFVGTVGACRFACRRQSAERGLYITSVNFVQLLDVADDLRNLGREHLSFLIGNFQVRQLGDLFNVGFRYWHLYQSSVCASRREIKLSAARKNRVRNSSSVIELAANSSSVGSSFACLVSFFRF